ncbi:MAG: NAD(P)-dependent alcohol dehydrogenase [Gaiellaceae bacterium]|jgi:NADPH:quinone reductase-like Zn-dependent oxidoreductase
MKAAVCTRYGPPDVLHVREVERPAPKRNDLLVRVRASAVTSSDWIVRSGFGSSLTYRILGRLAVGIRAPRRSILGLVVVGDVEAVGDDVSKYEVGDQVFALTMTRFGGYAQYACLPESSLVGRKPSNLTHAEAASIPYGGLLALHFLRKGVVGRRRRVLIYGASGAVGTSAVQLARWFGADVTGVCSIRNLELVRSLGADTVIDYTREDVTAGGRSYDLIFVAVGDRLSPPSKSACRGILTPDGAYVFVDQGRPKLRAEDLVFLEKLAKAGHLKPVIDRSYPLEEIAAAHRYVEQEHKRGNVIIRVD